MKRVYRADLHVHSRYSDRPAQRLLRRLDCPESFAEPRVVYDAARRRGMDFVTLTDHDTLAGSLAIADLPGTFVSVELNAWFPEDRYKLHLVALDISEAQFADAMALRGNVYELADYLRGAGIVHFPAHPLFTMTGALTADVVERMLLLFDVFEVRNGARAAAYNRLITRVVDDLTGERIAQLADKHGVEPRGVKPWIKAVVGGSDDHSGLFTASAYTEVEIDPAPLASETSAAAAVRNLDDPLGAFLSGIHHGASRAVGGHGDPLLLAHSIYNVGWLFMKRELEPARRGWLPWLSRHFGRQFGPMGDGRNMVEKVRWWTRSHLSGLYRRDGNDDVSVAGSGNAKENGRASADGNGNGQGNGDHPTEGELLEELLDAEAGPLMDDSRQQMSPGEINRRIFTVTSRVADTVVANELQTKVKPALQGYRPLSRDPLDVATGLGTIGFAHFLSIPYYAAFSNQTRDRELLHRLSEELLGHAGEHRRVALFCEAPLSEGVPMRLRRLRAAAEREGAAATIVCCSEGPADRTGQIDGFDERDALDGSDGVAVFRAVDTTATPLFPGRAVVVPPLLEILDHLDAAETTALHADAPGPMGLAALACARLLHVPISARWPSGIVGPSRLTRRYLSWFYRHVDEVMAPTDAAHDWLLGLGVPAHNVRPTPSWMRAPVRRPGSTLRHSGSVLRLDRPS